MTGEIWGTVAAILVLVVLSAFFSGSETALTAASRARMLQLEKAGTKRAGMVGQLIQARETLIGAMLLGNNVANILSSALATSLCLRAIRKWLRGINVRIKPGRPIAWPLMRRWLNAWTKVWGRSCMN